MNKTLFNVDGFHVTVLVVVLLVVVWWFFLKGKVGPF